jgi:DNA mismatch endonuclease, patch repair protein
MSAIRGKNTKPEMRVRSFLHRAGLRFRLHRADLPGKPDIVLPGRSVAIFVHGCFWHWHGCKYSVWPKTRAEFWREKIMGNVQRDRRHVRALRRIGWRPITVWECQTSAEQLDRLLKELSTSAE